MDLPSADHLGQQMSPDPGSCSNFRVARSRIWMETTSLPPIVRVWPNAIFVPSVDQVGSRSEIAPFVICSAGPPAEGIRKIFQGFPGRVPENAMRFPSGDQCGKDTRSDGPVNCAALLPFAFARHNVPSGYRTYTNDSPSREGSTSPAEIPPRKGTYCSESPS